MASVPSGAEAGASVGRGHVVVVDDDDEARDSVAALLAARGYEVEAYGSALSALERLRTCAGADVIVLDLQMPDMDGWEFRLAQKREPRLRKIPVIVLSGDVSAEAQAIDARACLQKPVEADVLLATLEQIESERELERRREATQELDRRITIGMMVGGIAHAINDPLAVVLGTLELADLQMGNLVDRLDGGSETISLLGLAQSLARVRSGAERISTIVRYVSMFARADGEVRAVDVHEVLESSLQLAGTEIRHAARLERAYGGTLHVRANPAQLTQVFLNVLLRAVHAIQESPREGHVIRVETRSEGGDQVVIAISDTGRALLHMTRAGVLERPFTSMATGSTIDLGLAVGIELVAGMGGSIALEPSARGGSTILVRLPSTSAVERPTAAPATEREALSRARVLVLDDEPLTAQLLASMLASDYEVRAFTSPYDALAAIRTEPFDVLLCDLMMPELSGMDVYAQVAAVRPELVDRMVFITGGAFTDRAREFLARHRPPQVIKPFRRGDLVAAIESVLVAPDGAATVSARDR